MGLVRLNKSVGWMRRGIVGDGRRRREWEEMDGVRSMVSGGRCRLTDDVENDDDRAA